MGPAVRPAQNSAGPWDALADVDAFVDDVLAELADMAADGARPRRSGPEAATGRSSAAEPSAVVIDSRPCRSAPSCFARGIDGGKTIRGVKIQMAVEKYGIPLAIDVTPANRHDSKAIVPVLRELANGGFIAGPDNARIMVKASKE